VNEQDLLIAAMQIDDRTKRAAYLVQACGDDLALQKRLELLLGQGDRGGSVELPFQCDGPVSEASVHPDPTIVVHYPSFVECPGTVIGPYKLLQKIGEGGMGAVFIA
jgi:eukaryotic-like serine/threonine-protein kinase